MNVVGVLAILAAVWVIKKIAPAVIEYVTSSRWW